VFFSCFFIADCGSVYNIKVTIAISESVESTDVLRGKEELKVCLLLYDFL